MTLNLAHKFLIATFLLGAAPAFAEGTGAVTNEDGTIIPPGSTVVLEAGEAVVITQTPAMNVGLEGIVAWGTTSKGPAWVDIKGMALYNYDLDTEGQSVCNGDCAAAWPPLRAEAGIEGALEWTVVTRDDGTFQWAFRGHPLYTFVKDLAPGEVNGDGVAGFHLAD